MRIRIGLVLLTFVAAACSDDTTAKKKDFKPRAEAGLVDQEVLADQPGQLDTQGPVVDKPQVIIDRPPTKVDTRKPDQSKIDQKIVDRGPDQPPIDRSLIDQPKVEAGTGTGLVINEIDYDQVSPPSDDKEFVEIFNPTSAAVSLTNLSLMFVNGGAATPAVYRTVSLSPAGSLGPGEYLVVCSTNVTVPATAKKINFNTTGSQNDRIENGPKDGVALVNTSTKTILDALSYEGGITSVTLTGFTGTSSLVEGTVLATTVEDSNVTANVSLCRKPNGQDTNNANADWKACTALTIGAAN